MSELAKQILKKAKKEKATFVDLGNCGLDGYLPDELFDDYFPERLVGLSLGYFASAVVGVPKSLHFYKFKLSKTLDQTFWSPTTKNSTDEVLQRN